MAAYTLYYWPIPFRGEFVRAVLRLADQSYDEPGMDEVARLKGLDTGAQPLPFMAPPVLIDHEAGISLAQFPAILRYLGDKHGLMSDSPALKAITDKIICDANDVLGELTLFGGRSMWTLGEWETFVEDRMPRWMEIFEETLRARAVAPDAGYVSGQAVTLADVVIAVLWGVMTQKLSALRPLLVQTAPRVAGLSDRILALPCLAALRAENDARWGPLYCGGQIEASIRDMLSRQNM